MAKIFWILNFRHWRFLWLLFFFSPLFAFKFCVLGDRTPQSSTPVFEQVMREIKILKPDFVVHLGNLIKGKGRDTSGIKREWDDIKKAFDELGIPYYLCPGSEDIWDEKSEEIYLRYFNKTYYSFHYENYHFIILDFSRFAKYSDLPKEMIDWLVSDLSLNRRARYTFVFAHRPYWRVLKERFPLHKILSRFGVDYFFSGYDCFYTYHLMDSLNYFQVGPTGARFKGEEEEARGAFPNYLLVEVDKKRVNISVIRPGAIFPPDVVTLKAIEEESLTTERVTVSSFNLGPSQGEGFQEVMVSLENPFSYELKGELSWISYSWSVSPLKAKFYLSPWGKGSFPFTISSKGEVFPLPELLLSYQKEGKEEVIRKTLRIRREFSISKITPKIDGEMKEWKGGIEQFGDEKGRKAKLNSLLFLGFDSLNLYLGVLNHEKKVRARVRERDGLIKEDDFVSIFLSPIPDTIYEISFNPLGFILDNLYFKEKGRYKRKEWNGRYEIKSIVGEDYWQAEIGIPFAILHLGEKKRLGFNLGRYSPEDSLSLYFQPPTTGKPPTSFRIDAENLGVLFLE